MANQYCLEICIPQLTNYSSKANGELSDMYYHAHLYIKNEQIELKIFFQSNDIFEDQMNEWIKTISWKDFGKHIKVRKEKKNPRVKKIDFSESTLVSLQGSSIFEEGQKYISIIIDSCKIYYNPQSAQTNKAEFYLNNAGFDVVKEYYPILSGNNGHFKIEKYPAMDCFYKIGNAWFRPKFDFLTSDFRDIDQAKVIKKPKIEFYYPNGISEVEALEYADKFRIVASFYYHSHIDFSFSRIFLKDSVLTIEKRLIPSYKDEFGTLKFFKNFWSFHELLISPWQKHMGTNYKKLSKVVELFIQSLQVNGSSAFLCSYNILEICKSGEKENGDKFELVVSEEDRAEKYNQALNVLLTTVSKCNHDLLTTRWNDLAPKLMDKPMKGPLRSFLENEGINPDKLGIKLSKIKDIRNLITHGSLSKVREEELEWVNALLYRMTGVLILNRLGVDEWELDTEFK